MSNDVFYALYSWIDKHSREKQFIYEGIDILQAYGERLYYFLFTIVQEETVKNSTKNTYSTITSEMELSYKNDNFSARELLDSFLNTIRKTTNFLRPIKNKKILIYSDLNRVEVITELLKKEVIFLRDSLPTSLFFPLLSKGIIIKLTSDYRISLKQKENLSRVADEMINKMEKSSEVLYLSNNNFSCYVKKYLLLIWQKELAHVFQRIEQFHSLFKTVPIVALLVDEDRTVDKNLLVQVSKQYSCKSYVNCHGEPFLKIGYIPLVADYIFVWGEHQKTILIQAGLEANKIIVNGSSKHDLYVNVDTAVIKRKICKDLQLSQSKTILLIAPHPIFDKRTVWKRILWPQNEAIIRTASTFKELQIVVKLHPGDVCGPEIRFLAKSLGIREESILIKYDSLVLAKGVDLLIVNKSTFAIDGLAYQKPVVLADEESVERYKNLNVFYDGTTEEKLKDSIEGILSGKYKNHLVNWQTAANYLFNGVDGKASERIVKRLLENE